MKTLTFPAKSLFSSIILSLFIIVAACKKTATHVPAPSNDGAVLIEATIDNANIITKETFYYNSDNLMSRIADTSTNAIGTPNWTPFISLEFLYDNNKELATAKYFNDKGLMEPVYHVIKPNDHFKVLEPTYFTINPDASNYWLGMDNNGRIIADTGFKRSSASIVTISHYTYDVNGNMVERNNYIPNGSGGYKNSSTWTYTYDQKANPFYNSGIYSTGSGSTSFAPVAYFSFCKNNLLTETVNDKQAGTTTQMRTYAYEYNKSNMPVKRTLNRTGYYEVTTYKYK